MKSYPLFRTLLSTIFYVVFTFQTNAQLINWQKTLGGSQDDQAAAVATTLDGGYVFVGSTASSDGDVTTNQGGLSDIWVVKLIHVYTRQHSLSYILSSRFKR